MYSIVLQAFPRDSPFAEDLSTAILTLSENVHLQRIHDEWLAATKCGADNNVGSSSLSLSSFWGLFLICGLACVLALVIFFLRILCQYNRYSNQVEVQFDGPQIINRPARLTSIKSLISFVDKKEEEVKNALKKKPNGSQHPSIPRMEEQPSLPR
jgi:glutamate receptor, ionotropic, plant